MSKVLETKGLKLRKRAIYLNTTYEIANNFPKEFYDYEDFPSLLGLINSFKPSDFSEYFYLITNEDIKQIVANPDKYITFIPQTSELFSTAIGESLLKTFDKMPIPDNNNFDEELNAHLNSYCTIQNSETKNPKATLTNAGQEFFKRIFTKEAYETFEKHLTTFFKVKTNESMLTFSTEGLKLIKESLAKRGLESSTYKSKEGFPNSFFWTLYSFERKLYSIQFEEIQDRVLKG